MKIVEEIFRLVNKYLQNNPSLRDDDLKNAAKKLIDFEEEFGSLPEGTDKDLLFNQVMGKINYQRAIKISGTTTIIEDKESKPWVMERLENNTLSFEDWELYKVHMLDLDRGSFNVLDSSTNLILDKSGNPLDKGPWSRRGLVMGSVQSGKTANYLGLINKASDAGYKIIIILSGIHNLLREQTQIRIDEGFGGKVTSGKTQQTLEKYIGVGPSRRLKAEPFFPIPYTTSESDFNKMKQDILPVLNTLKSPVYMVLKKNSKVLEAVVNWAQSNTDDNKRMDEPLLLIDDEADNASINTSNKINEVTKINRSIRTILRLFSRRTYIGYTATPFANIFIDPDDAKFNTIIEDDIPSEEDDLFPANFIVQLDSSNAYCGPENFFGSDPDKRLVKVIDDENKGRDDLELMIPYKHNKNFKITQLSDSLKNAIRTFIVIKAIRLHRGQVGENHSMLVNVTFYTLIQQDLKDYVYEFKNRINQACIAYAQLEPSKSLQNKYIKDLKNTFDAEFIKKDNNIEIDFLDLLPHLQAASTLEVLAINGKSKDALNYSKKEYPNGRTVIAIGGHSLSRGFTLEGLSVSYFTRNTKVSDTLLQMARWFGYRPNYEDLCRLFITSSAKTYYSQVTQTIEELNDEIKEMERLGKSPKDFGLKVREHPGGLEVTARNKIGTGSSETRKLSFWGVKHQKVRLFLDENKNKENLKLLEKLIVTATKSAREREDWDLDKGKFWRDVPSNSIRSFIQNFNSPTDIKDSLLLNFLKRLEDENLFLDKWNLWFYSLKSGEEKQFNTIKLNPRKRTEGISINNNEIVFNNNNIGDAKDDADLLDKEKAFKVSEEYLRNNTDKKSTPGWAYRAKLDNPTLIVHPLYINKEEVNHEPFSLTYTVHFPLAEDNYKDIKVSYLVNSVDKGGPQDAVDEEEEPDE